MTALTTLDELKQLTNHYIQAATSDNTRKAYQQDIRHFLDSRTLPTTPEILLNYLQSYAEKLNPRTLKRRLTAIKHWHTSQGFEDPTTHPLIRKTLSGIMRIHGKPLEKAQVLSTDQLKTISKYLTVSGKLIDWRNNALLQIGFFGAFRRSELVAIHWEHVTFVPEGLTIMIPRSKTDQHGEGHVCAIPSGNENLCPVLALKSWQHKCNLLTGPVFRGIDKGGYMQDKALSPASVSEIIKNIAANCDIDNPDSFSGHSLRRGFATTASQKGVSMGAIMRQGRWKHEGTVQGYIEEGCRFDANAAGAILGDV